MRVRIQEPDNPAFVKGNAVHSTADIYIGGIGSKRPSLLLTLPPEAPGAKPVKVDMSAIKPDLDMLRKAKSRSEQEWAFTKAWLPTGWFDKDAWLRIKTDACADTVKPPTVLIVDWKTGKQYDDHRQQRSLYALGGLQLVQIGALAGGSKDVDLTVKHVYVDFGKPATETFKMKDLAPLKREWLARIKGMMSDTKFDATPGRHCSWCKFNAKKGGPCKSGV